MCYFKKKQTEQKISSRIKINNFFLPDLNDFSLYLTLYKY